uniref:Secreted protein n=1 Tax=Rhizophora mucronata TaxID=61149 RepID=A0A2P2K1B2_RHIMU
MQWRERRINQEERNSITISRMSLLMLLPLSLPRSAACPAKAASVRECVLAFQHRMIHSMIGTVKKMRKEGVQKR